MLYHFFLHLVFAFFYSLSLSFSHLAIENPVLRRCFITPSRIGSTRLRKGSGQGLAVMWVNACGLTEMRECGFSPASHASVAGRQLNC